MRPDRAAGGMLRWARSYGLPVVAAVVACVQLWFVHTQGLTSWRGGGFGMYARFHPVHTDVWVTNVATGERSRDSADAVSRESHIDEIERFRRFVNEDAVEGWLDTLPADERAVARVEVWRLDFDLDTREVTRVRMLAVGTDP